MTPSTPEIARRRAALRRIGHSISMEGGSLPADLTTDADDYARVLYQRLRALDARGVDVILAAPPEPPPPCTTRWSWGR